MIPEEQSARSAMANRYFASDLAGQRHWYSETATRNKRRSQALSLLIVLAGSAVTVVQVTHSSWLPMLSALLGATVVIAEGCQRIFDYGHTWRAYRAASEAMKREQRLFLNSAGPYRNMSDDDAYLVFVERVEAIIGDENQGFVARASGNEQQLSHNAIAEAGTRK